MRRIAAVVVAVLLAGCGSSEKSYTAGGATVTDDSKGNASITTDKGTIRTAQGDAAANVKMPDFAPRYPGSTVSNVIETETDGGKQKMVTLNTSGTIANVADFYKASLAKAGWKVPTSFISGDAGMVMGQKDSKQVTVSISRNDQSSTDVVVAFPG